MHLSAPLALSLATLALAHPSVHTNRLEPRDGIPYGAFPSSSSASPAIPTATPPAESRRLGHAIVQNYCTFPVYLWSVGTEVQSMRTVDPDSSYSEMFREDSNTGGIAIKLSTEIDGLYTSAPQMIFAYNLSYFKVRGDNGEKVWYDLSDVFGDPFDGFPVSLAPAEPAISWENGIPPARSQVRVIASWTDLVLSLC